MKQKHTVLVIDDYPSAREAVQFALKDEFECLSAESGERGLEILRTNPVDVVVLDIRMPEMDGIEALKRIKRMGIDSQVILLTGYGSLETARKAVRYGAFDYLIKPFNVANLREVVKQAVEKKSLLDSEGKDTEFQKLTENLTAKLADASRLARVGELSSESLREMKNPLTAILGYTQMLLKNLKEKRIRLFSAKSLRYLSIIEEEANQCVEIASRLTSLSREDRNRDGASVNEALLNVGALLRPQCSIKGIDLTVTPPSEQVVVDVPSDDLHGILVSVVLNALEATEGPGQIDLTSYTFSRESPMSALLTPAEEKAFQHTPQGPLVAIEVTDTGRGVDPQHLDKIFEPFFTTKESGSGKGLGLSICRERVERNGGHIGVVGSRPGETIMRIILPVSRRV